MTRLQLQRRLAAIETLSGRRVVRDGEQWLATAGTMTRHFGDGYEIAIGRPHRFASWRAAALYLHRWAKANGR